MASPEDVARVDAHGMYAQVVSLPEQLLEGLKVGRGAFPPGDFGRVWVCGMGASGIVGDLAASWTAGAPAVRPVRDERLPAEATRRDLVVAVSFSGDTEETLAAFAQALDLGCPAVAVTTGGRLLALCQERGLPAAVVPRTVQARAALGYLLGALAPLLGAPRARELEAAAAELAKRRADLAQAMEAPRNLAKRLAGEMLGKACGVLALPPALPVARRWATQLHENAKVLAWASELPEADHNEIVAWLEDPGESLPILLRLPDESAAMRRRLDLTAALIAERRPVVSVPLEGATPIARLLAGVQLADLASFYLAVLRGVDPTPQRAIDVFKQRLRGR